MPEFQPVVSAPVAAIERPSCPTCQQSRMLLAKLATERSGFDRATFECQKCGRVETRTISIKRATFPAISWLAGGLRSPT